MSTLLGEDKIDLDTAYKLLREHIWKSNDKSEAVDDVMTVLNYAIREGFPVPDEKMSKDDWKMYYLSVKKYLKNWVILNPINTIGDHSEVEEVAIQEEPAIPIIPEHKGRLEDIEF